MKDHGSAQVNAGAHRLPLGSIANCSCFSLKGVRPVLIQGSIAGQTGCMNLTVVLPRDHPSWTSASQSLRRDTWAETIRVVDLSRSQDRSSSKGF